MKTFICSNCNQILFFENSTCLGCESTVGYLPDVRLLDAVEEKSDGVWQPSHPTTKPPRRYKLCQNYEEAQVCNWLIPVADSEPVCYSCRLNDTIPNLDVAGNRAAWYEVEQAKRRLIYTLDALNLPVISKDEAEDTGLAFDFLLPTEDEPVLTGHANGLITINLLEADDAYRERARRAMGEPYRTLLGHFRHESGHYYWELLINGTDWLTEYRSLFGDEQVDYQEALEAHYEDDDDDSWQAEYISHYASAHSWEDWAETWAHYLHIIDTLETATTFDLAVTWRDVTTNLPTLARIRKQPFNETLKQWFPLAYALNSLNRSMGLADAYPFVMPPPVVNKLSFVHQVVMASR